MTRWTYTIETQVNYRQKKTFIVRYISPYLKSGLEMRSVDDFYSIEEAILEAERVLKELNK